ncbi:hypothetical protein HJC10_40390 [Corallococcus exiguus]|uniref:hypothetical protein n=1 Tax=Corallococcus TaxID=83461 RepID=UPI000EDC7AFA|nr:MULTISPECIES: hypothetical protein [Corallococcus]NNB90752.1 hypothetical protein [Corallococcus exiguus]NNB99843.1 hypothetical protein [Corallococcus exiguus]NNC09072.1 hypothetical protein [Corallococcus exiguus]NPC51259.1 hypothetical protein [Corallococcus exiguus]RKH79719.1 hypothetical protein D7X99_24370 [Corallococcus sp. AB032C]
MKLPLFAAIAALSLYGCASHNATTREASSPEAGAVGGSGSAGTTSANPDTTDGTSGSIDPADTSRSTELPGETGNVSDLEKRDRKDAPTVYDGEATGGSGAAHEAVKTGDGQKWDVQQNTPTDLGDSQVPAGAVNQNRNPSEKGNLGTGGSGDLSTDGKSDVSEETESGALNGDVDAPSTDSSKVDTDATPDPTN